MSRTVGFCAALLIAVLSVAAAWPQIYPTRPIRMIVPFAPGGGNDILGRIVGRKLGEQLGHQIVIDNRGGAGGIIGTGIAAKALPDGYTLLVGGSGALSITPNLHAKLPYHPVRDFAPISLIATAPSILVVHPSLPAKSVNELIALAKARPGRLNYSSGGIGAPGHVFAELFKSMAGVNIAHVPYNSGGQSLLALVVGEVELSFNGIPTAVPLLRDGKLRGIAVTSIKRTAVAPEMPTIAETGLPGFESVIWYGILAPARTPRKIIASLHAEIVKVVAAPDTRKLLLDLGADPVHSSPEELAAYMRDQLEKWGKVIKSEDVRPE